MFCGLDTSGRGLIVGPYEYVYLAGWFITLIVTCLPRRQNRNVLGDAIAAVAILAWPLLWLLSAISLIILARDRKKARRSW